MFRVKICGIRTVDDALDAAAAGAEAIGLNFHGPSPRCTDLATAQRIAISLPAGIKKVGVFVNAAVSDISATASQVPLDVVQLHGDERPDVLSQLPRSISIIRAHRLGKPGLEPLRGYLAACRSHGRSPDAVLIDADAGETFGGTGRVTDWSRLAEERRLVGNVRLILAGGLTPENVAEAIAQVRPDGVDVASGVEREPGRKDAALVKRFVAAAREAFAKI